MGSCKVPAAKKNKKDLIFYLKQQHAHIKCNVFLFKIDSAFHRKYNKICNESENKRLI